MFNYKIFDMILGFADEWGNNSFDFEKQDTHFIIASILLKEENDLSQIENTLEQIRKKYFQTGEIKSNKVGSNHTRRMLILQEINKLEFSIFAVVVNKKELYSEGLTYKKSFYKFINNLLYKELFRTFPNIRLSVDEHGSNKFMAEFRRYVEKQHPRTLFSEIEFVHDNSKQSILIQLADFIAGTLGFIYDENKKSKYSQNFLKLIEDKITYISHFPYKLSSSDFLNSKDIENTKFDKEILEACFQRVFDFIERNESSDDNQIVEQIQFLRLLYWLQRSRYKNSYISTKEIMQHMNYIRETQMNEEYFRSKIVGNLRDKGVVIASSNKGYKIPTSLSDVKSFINQGNRVIMPMLNRIRVASDTVKLATLNEVDVLDSYVELKNIIDINNKQ